MSRRITHSPFLTVLALLVSVLPAVTPVRAADRQPLGTVGSPASGLKITLPTHDLSTGPIQVTSTGFTLTLTNHLAVFYSIDPQHSAVTSTMPLWGRGLLGPKQQVTLSFALSASGQGVLLTFNPTTTRAVTLDELVIAIDLVEVYLGIDVDPVAVLNAAPDLISVGAELLGASDYSAPLGALQKVLAANSLPDRALAITGLSTSLATVLAKPALVKRLAPLLAAGLSGAGHTTVTQKSVTSAMTGLTPVLNGLSRLIVGGRIGAMFVDFGKLLAERATSPDNNAFAPLIPFRLTVTAAPVAPPVQRVRWVTLDDPNGVQGTSPRGINGQGDIVGYYVDSAAVDHGFLLHHGTYTTIDPNGAQGTVAWGINDQGDIVGSYVDTGNVPHGFLLHHGTYTTMDDPNSVKGTTVSGINPQGDIVGTNWDSADTVHGFQRSTGS